MAKMFYNLDEAAAQLHITPDQVKQLALGGKLQQFRDRDQLMFKREQVDALAQQGAAGKSGGPIPLAGDETDKLDLSDSRTGKGDSKTAGSGISVFEADEIEAADPMAQTQITKAPSGEDDLALDNVGSGSGLLDLTRESDDTSLGAELLDEIYPGEKEGGKASSGVGTGVEPALSSEASGPSGLESLQSVSEGAPVPVSFAPAETFDAAGSGLSVGLLIGATIALVVLGMVSATSLAGVPMALTTTLAASTGTLLMYAGGLLAVSILCGLIGFFVGKSRG